MVSEDIPEEISIEDFITFPKYKYPHDPLDDLSISYSQPFCPYCGGSINTGFKCMNCGKQFHPNVETLELGTIHENFSILDSDNNNYLFLELLCS